MAEERTRPLKMRGGRGMAVPKEAIKPGTMKRLLKYIFHYYKPSMIVVFVCLVLSAAGGLVSTVFMQQITDGVLKPAVDGAQSFAEVEHRLVTLIITMGAMYVVAIVASFLYNRILAIVTQGILCHFREDMFNKMETLPIKYFDTHAHGDIMSTYTNDTDAARQLVGQSLPTLCSSVLTVTICICTMLWYSIWLTLIVALTSLIMLRVVRRVGGASSRYMVAQQRSIAVEEGFVEEMMKGQKVVKVFTHEEAAMRDFDRINEQLYKDSERAHAFGNVLGPILANIGNFAYVLLAVIGGVLRALQVPNLGVSSIATGIAVVSPGIILAFLGMSRQFTQTVNQAAQQYSMIAMGLAGVGRIFDQIGRAHV